MDTKEIAMRVADRMFIDPISRVRFADVIAEELDAAAKPVEKVKTAGEVAAEALFGICEGLSLNRHLEIRTKDGPVCVAPAAPRWELNKDLPKIRKAVAEAFDSQRADAAKEERELHGEFLNSVKSAISCLQSESAMTRGQAMGILCESISRLDAQYAKYPEGGAL